MRTILLNILIALLLAMSAHRDVLAHHQISYLAPAVPGIAAFIGSGHILPLGESFSGLDKYSEVSVIHPSGKRVSLKKATNMGVFGFSVLPSSEQGLHVLVVAAEEHFGTRTTTGYFRGTRQQAIAAGKRVIDSKQTFRFSKSYRQLGGKNTTGKTPMEIGHKIEIVPDHLDTPLRQGGRAAATVMLDGKPLRGVTIGALSVQRGGKLGHMDEPKSFHAVLETDAQGRAELPLLEKGWMVYLTEVVQPDPMEGVDKRYISTTLSLWVQ